MNKQMYSLKTLSDELGQSRQNIRRRLIKLGIKAINEDTREYMTDPLQYDYEAFNILIKEFDVQLRRSDSISKEEPSITNDEEKNKLIKQLKVELIKAEKTIEYEREQNSILNQSRSNLERLLDQQQQLSLSDRNKIKALEIELEETSEKSLKEEKKEIINENKTNKWYEFWK